MSQPVRSSMGSDSAWARLRALLVWHFNTNRQERTAEEERRDGLLLGRPFNRWLMVPAAIVVQACVGEYFAWTVYNVPIEHHLGASEGSAAVTIFIMYIFVGLSAAACGPLVDRKGPRRSLQAGATVIYVGHLVAALGVHVRSMGLVYFGYGVLVGLGTGVAFLCPISPLLKWFPERRGLMSMLGVVGFNVGTITLSLLEGLLIAHVGVSWTLGALGTACYVLYLASSLVLRTPPPGWAPGPPPLVPRPVSDVGAAEKAKAGPDTVLPPDSAAADIGPGPGGAATADAPDGEWTLLQSLRTRTYACTYFMFVAVHVPPFLLSAKLADMCVLQFGVSQRTASVVVAGYAAIGIVGRLVSGTTSDQLGRRNFYLASQAVQGVCLLALPTVFSRGLFGIFVVLVMAMGLVNIGATLAAGFLADLFGPKHVAGMYGFLLTAAPTCVGVIGGTVFAGIYKAQAAVQGPDGAGVYNINFYWMAALAFVGFAVTLLIHKPTRHAPAR